MKLSDILVCALRELRRRKWRTSTTLLGYALAAGILVILFSALVCSQRNTDAVLGSTGTHFVAYSPVGGPACAQCRPVPAETVEEGFVVYGQATRLIPFEVVDRARALPSVRDASPYLLFRFRDAATGETISVGGFDPAAPQAVGTTCCAPSDIVAGRFLAPGDAGAVMVEEAYAISRDLKPGDRVTIAGEDLPIAGVVNPGIRAGKADVYLHFPTAERLVNSRLGLTSVSREANVILVEVKSSRRQEEAMEAVKALLPGLVLSTYACYRPAAAVMGMNQTSIVVLAALLGAFAVALALKSQLASVLERRRDMAVLRAIGWSDGNVVRQVLAESVLEAVLGGLVGCALAAILLVAVPARLLVGSGATGTVGLSGEVVLAGWLLAILGGVLAGTVPAIVATREAPAGALRRL